MGLKEIIRKLIVIAALAESSMNKEGTNNELVYINREDVEAIRGAIEILDGVQYVKKLLKRRRRE